MTWYVVSEYSAKERKPFGIDPPSPEEAVWTLSEDPTREGWITDCDSDGYGLTKEKAQFLADAANRIEGIQAELDAEYHRGYSAALGLEP